MRILFICLGNICRSPMAEFMLKDITARAGLRWEIASRATSNEEAGHDLHPGARRALEAAGVPFTVHRATRLTAEDYNRYDLLFCMETRNVRDAARICGGDPAGKLRRLLADRDIADPWYTGDFMQTYSDLEEGCRALIRQYGTKP